MAALTKKFELAEGVESFEITLNSGGRTSDGDAVQPKTINKWPYETKNPNEVRALRNSRSLKEAQPEMKATSAAQRKADELGVDIEEVEPTGSDGSVTVDDVEKAASSGEDN